jgi:hypothetical protein
MPRKVQSDGNLTIRNGDESAVYTLAAVRHFWHHCSLSPPTALHGGTLTVAVIEKSSGAVSK